MALKDTWQDLENKIEGIPDSGSDLTVEPINEIARAVIELEENGTGGGGAGGSITVDDKMSDTSTNPVQNKVIKKYVDDSIRTSILDSWEVPV